MESIDMRPDSLSSLATSLTEDQKFAAHCRSCARWSMRARARAVMGNHEFNALLYHTKGPDGEWLRPHNEKNTVSAPGDAGSDCAIMTRLNGKTGWIGCCSCRFGWTWARAAWCTLHGTTLLSRPVGPAIPWLKSLLPKPEDARLRRAVR